MKCFKLVCKCLSLWPFLIHMLSFVGRLKFVKVLGFWPSCVIETCVNYPMCGLILANLPIGNNNDHCSRLSDHCHHTAGCAHIVHTVHLPQCTVHIAQLLHQCCHHFTESVQTTEEWVGAAADCDFAEWKIRGCPPQCATAQQGWGTVVATLPEMAGSSLNIFFCWWLPANSSSDLLSIR